MLKTNPTGAGKGVRTAAEYLAGLQDDREVWTGGERVKDVRVSARLTTSPACVVADEHELLRAEHDRDEALGLRRLRRLVDEHLPEAHRVDARVAGGRARAADDVRRLKDLALGGALELVVLFLVGLRELAQLLLEHPQLVQLCLVRRVEVAHLHTGRIAPG